MLFTVQRAIINILHDALNTVVTHTCITVAQIKRLLQVTCEGAWEKGPMGPHDEIRIMHLEVTRGRLWTHNYSHFLHKQKFTMMSKFATLYLNESYIGPYSHASSHLIIHITMYKTKQTTSVQMHTHVYKNACTQHTYRHRYAQIQTKITIKELFANHNMC